MPKTTPITGAMFYNLATVDLEDRFPADFLLQPPVQELIFFFSEQIENTFDRIVKPCDPQLVAEQEDSHEPER